MTERAALVARVAAFVRGETGEDFAAVALAVHRHQRALHSAIDRFAAALPPPRDWRDLPALPVDVLKDPGVGEGRVVFRTSGTTAGHRGEHRLVDTALYDLGAVRWARACVPGLPRRTVSLVEDLADSSLAHMVRRLGDPVSWHVTGGRVDAASLRALPATPVFVPSTAFALADWLESRPDPLPPGSVVMVTGGYKGRLRSIAAEDLLRTCRAVLRPARLVLEYGMTELSSQLWGLPGTPFLPPPWMRVQAVDADGAPLPPGAEGQLRFVDLCNVDVAVAIETMDLGVVDGAGCVSLRGRLPGAPPRGCSLAAEPS